MASEEPLDEIQWSAPHKAAEMQGIHSNSVLHYFAESVFFDRTSNNAIITSQAMYNPSMQQVVQTREAMEAYLKTMSGLEFMVAQAPAEQAPGTGTGVWVIRKQTRKKKQPEEDEIMVHNTYYVVGEHIYMAPSIADVLGSRMLSILSSFKKFSSIAAALPDFSPALGHTYMPPAKPHRPKTQDSQPGLPSKESAPLPEALSGPRKAGAVTVASSFKSDRLLEETLNVSLRYGDEYMDENPITGTPGAFNLSNTGRIDHKKLAVPVTKLRQMPGKTEPAESPVKIDVPAEKKTNLSSDKPRTPGKLKRKKSKVGPIVPT